MGVNPEDIRIDMYRNAIPPGGNDDKRTVITHYPTGIVVSCDDPVGNQRQKCMAELRRRIRVRQKDVMEYRRRIRELSDL